MSVQSLRVSHLSRPDAEALIREPVPDFPDIYEAMAVEAIWQLTQGQPYLVQLLCFEIVEHLNRHQLKRATAAEVQAVLPAVFERGQMFFREFWQGTLTEAQQQLVHQLVHQKTIEDRQHDLAAHLVQKEILRPVGDDYGLCVPLLARWVETGQLTIDD